MEAAAAADPNSVYSQQYAAAYAAAAHAQAAAQPAAMAYGVSPGYHGAAAPMAYYQQPPQ